MKFFSLLILVMLTVLIPAAAFEVQSAADAGGRTYQYIPGDPFQARFYTLSNGMKLFLSRHTGEPRIQTAIAVRAGSADDPENSTGLAHYFEHMMFKGNSRIAALKPEREKPLLDQIEALFEEYRQEQAPEKRAAIYRRIDQLSNEASRYAGDEYWQLTDSIGAAGVNAYTSYDETVYISDIPADSLEKFLYLESVRFSDIALRRFHTELETVYEEFNRGQDNDRRLAFYTFMTLLFPRHPYGRQIIGLPEHLKSPSMRDIKTFFHRFYRPENMALILSGDLNYEQCAELAEKYFGRLKPEPDAGARQSAARGVREEPVTAPRFGEVTGPKREQLLLGCRLEATPENDRMLELIIQILNNGKCGLLDQDLILPQKVLSLSAGSINCRDYLAAVFTGEPKPGQTLEELRTLIMAEIAKLRQGDFPDWLPEAVVNNMRLALVTASENRKTACHIFLDAFVRSYSPAETLNRPDRLSRTTKRQIVEFARKNFAPEQFVTVYKRSGPPQNRVHAAKPPITPVQIPEERSPFFKDFAAMPALPCPKPVFPDLKKELAPRVPGQPANCYWVENRENERFSLAIVFPAGILHDRRLAPAFALAPYLGLGGRSAAELQKELYKAAGSVTYDYDYFTVRICISGLNRNRDRILELVKELKWTPNEKVWEARRAAILKTRENARKDQTNILNHAVNFAMYRSMDNLANLYLPETELQKLTAADLTAMLNELTTQYARDYVLYAPEYFQLQLPEGRKLPPPAVEYRAVPPAQNSVFFLHYPMVQTIALLRQPDTAELPRPHTFASVFNNFANTKFWTELRERRALAYSAGAGYRIPEVMVRDYSYSSVFITTQPDKLLTAVDAILQEINTPPADSTRYAAAVTNILSRIRNSRLHPENYYDTMLKLKRQGLSVQPEQLIWEQLPSLTQEQFRNIWKERIAGKKYFLIIIGDRNKVDLKALEKYGPVTELTLEQIYRK